MDDHAINITSEGLIAPVGFPSYMQRIYTPSSTPPPPHTPTPEEIAFEARQKRLPQHIPTANFDPVQSCYVLTYKETKRSNVTDTVSRAKTNRPMDAILKGMQKVGLGDRSPAESEEIPPDPEEYNISIDGDYREHARTIMIKMFSKGLGAMHVEKIQRTNDMISEAMLTSWDRMVGIVIWNLTRKNPFRIQTSTTRYLDKLFRGFRKTWIEICLANQRHMDFAEAVCRHLHQVQHIVKDLDMEFLNFYAQMFFLCSNGFWLIKYRTDREAIGVPLGVHNEHTFMDREKVPKQQVDFTLALLSNKNFDAVGNIDLPMEIIDCTGVCIKSLVQTYENPKSNDHNKNLLEMFARERIFGLDSFPELIWERSIKIRAKVISECPMDIFDSNIGDNGIRFRLQFLMAMIEKEKLPDTAAQSLKEYLMTLDPQHALDEFDQLVTVETLPKPRDLTTLVGEDPYVLTRLLTLYCYLRSPEKTGQNKRRKGKIELEPEIIALIWWVFVKESYENARPLHFPEEIALFTTYENWFLPYIKEQWGASSSRCTDILMGWFIYGLEKYGTILRDTEQRSHATLREFFHHKFGVEVAIALLQFQGRDQLIPIYERVKHRIIVSSFSILYFLVKNDHLYHDQEILLAIIKLLAETFIRSEWYALPEDQRPKGYYGVWKMGIEILNAAPYISMERAVIKCRDETYHEETRETFSALLKKCHRFGIGILHPPTNPNDTDNVVMIRNFNDAAVSLSHAIEFLLVLIPKDAYMRSRLREYHTVAPICGFMNMFVEKPEIPANYPRTAARPIAAFMKVPRASRGALAGLLQALTKYLSAIFKNWEKEDFLDAGMLEQRDRILGLALEGDIAADMLFKMDRKAGRYT
ncbi:hypothetical protein H072_6633 [Dactylellina haptotyla CBS 200.50]|uniref:Uncharacterized protein n=1 Tax=Dactylellina haptotyla (strain CBS 200.50) TaxID=1284197 RepID=S8BJQ7_DACHA|nr:hypothetical protein H072_6633 [Dactylellina haptotyla CBS 200.50]